MNIKKEEARARMKSLTVSRLGQFIFTSKNLLPAIFHIGTKIMFQSNIKNRNRIIIGEEEGFLLPRPPAELGCCAAGKLRAH